MKIIKLKLKWIFVDRCATGEAWPSIMLSCEAGRPCDPRALVNPEYVYPYYYIYNN